MYMNLPRIRTILKDTDFIHVSGTPQEKQVAEYLKAQCEAIGVSAALEPFKVEMADVASASLTADGKEIRCTGFRCCGSGTVEAPFIYLPNTDPASLTKAKDHIVMIDGGVTHFLYQDLLANGCKGIITYGGNLYYHDDDIDLKELRGFVRGDSEKLLCVNIHVKDAVKLVERRTKTVKLAVSQKEYEGASHNVVAEIPGTTDEWIAFTAHYDTTPTSRGQYDNMTGCLGLLYIMEALKKGAPHRYGLRFIFCGSEERGLLGSKAYTQDHEDALKKCALNINLDMIGTTMGKFIAVCTTEDGAIAHLKYLCAQQGWGADVRPGVYSSDSTPFADHGVPAISFARIAGRGIGDIHCRFDTAELLDLEHIRDDSAFIASYAALMADAALCPVKKEIPEKLRGELDEYLNRKRRKNG